MEDGLFPLLAKFRTSRFAYVYDGNTGHIARVDEALFEELQERTPFEPITPAAAAGPPSSGSVINERQARIKAMGLFRPVCLRNALVPPDVVKQNIAQLIGQFTKMTLEVTERCNLRCRYCPFTVGGEMRPHANSDMGWEVARRAIDYFLEHLRPVSSDGGARPTLGFYGGEPFLAFPLVRQSIKYISSRTPQVEFACTTNGTLLNGEIADCCAEHGIALLISLDGPREIHDRNRCSADGHGSFELVWSNVRRLKERYNDYYRKSVRFEATISAHADFGNITTFFLSEPELFGPGQVKINPATRFEIYTVDVANAYGKCVQRYEDKLLNGTMTDDAESQVLQQLCGKAHVVLRHRRRDIRGITRPGCLTGPCFPGFGRIFVSTEGRYYLCERINRRIAFGSVEHGVDHERITEFYSLYWKHFQEACSHCWAVGLCGLCYVQFARGAEDCRKVCCRAIEAWRQHLIRYCSILECNPHAFDHLKDLHITGTPVPDLGRLTTVASS
jgi:uncharacterized protein